MVALSIAVDSELSTQSHKLTFLSHDEESEVKQYDVSLEGNFYYPAEELENKLEHEIGFYSELGGRGLRPVDADNFRNGRALVRMSCVTRFEKTDPPHGAHDQVWALYVGDTQVALTYYSRADQYIKPFLEDCWKEYLNPNGDESSASPSDRSL